MERGEKCKTFQRGGCAWQEAQRYEKYLNAIAKTPVLVQYIFFIPTFVIDTRRLNLEPEIAKCSSCPRKQRNLG